MWSGRQSRDEDFVALLSGANMNFDRLRFVAERAEVGEFREALFGVTIPGEAGAFRQFCSALGPRVITEFNYRLNSRSSAEIFVGMSIRSREDAMDVQSKLNALGYETVDLTGSEMAKLHVRHMVGGHAQGCSVNVSAGSSFRSVPARCCNSWTRSAGGGTSVFSIIATMAATPAGCWPPSRCPSLTMPPLKDSWPTSVTSIRLQMATKPTGRFLGPLRPGRPPAPKVPPPECPFDQLARRFKLSGFPIA